MTDSPSTPQALIVGVGPGLGLSLARKFGNEGFALTIAGRSEQKLAEFATQLRSEGLRVDTAIADAADPKGFQASLQELAGKITPSVVVYNAAIVASDNILTSDIDYLITNYNIDALGAIIAAQVFTPAMRHAGTGTFLTSGGYAYIDPYPAYATIALGKGGLRVATVLIHKELKDEGVHVASVTIAGGIEPGTAMAPELIADTFWELHTQPADEWTAETVFDGTK
ncbi:SDR family NAD(P)-dependent oxidoreductase [Herbiconiux sp. CPCC 203407]|uniref:SDR family NAD(P)-dependent oxidoreductase n=1 Tax=Herbiconiux oxytropis TaxID=2970915 RepID=A0AA42BWN3_9MICO|nr:SDR family NAD(P)-dependent oxidoreductase [Herbiconiux oxytropis]MCS5721705.1 SDR family NAD(P)-dependent oxidoreductase [Herbiconiux oxytropis]MCS5726668.1 SDR family NAD(P)-dependent oxidoreductase [Herbiconiux oxytropis]